jgi:hypothetical protein
MHLVLATPIYGGAGAEYINTVLRLQAWLISQGIGVSTIFHSGAEIARSRNVIATRFWYTPEATHLLFIDSDMAFDPGVVESLIRANKPLVGCVYPRRGLDMGRLIAAARKHDDPRLVLTSALHYIVDPGEDSAIVENGLCSVRSIGMGVTLIERSVFAALIGTGQLRSDPGIADAGGGPTLGFFDPIPTEKSVLSEDYSFCKRWKDLCGGEIWAVLDQTIGHVGTMNFEGRALDALKQG